MEMWTCFDEEGIVFGYSSQVEVDVTIRGDRVALVEVKAHADASDVAALARKVILYKKVTGRAPVRKILVTPTLARSHLKRLRSWAWRYTLGYDVEPIPAP